MLLLDKPVGITSHDVVARVRRRLSIRCAGHLGTLDPGASGLLVVALGAATRCSTVWQGGEKTYEATLRLGVVTDSQDLQGAVLATNSVEVDEAALRATSLGLVGEIDQVPPMVSALKHKGERLYAIARRGETVDRPPRRVTVHEWRWLDFSLPQARFLVRSSGGTYIRTLAHDLGARLGCGAALVALRRLASAPFTVAQACAWEDLDALEPSEALARHGIGLDQALAAVPQVTLDLAGAEAMGRGQAVRVSPQGAPIGAGERSVVLRDGAGHALALGELRAQTEGVAAYPQVVFPWAVRQGRQA
ncbi:MAG: tRNA pseudouridine(55) synthase TruB [Candidatus Eisenbacteria bacterium]